MQSTRYPERHWTYDSEEENTSMPPFMNDGYAPPDWDIVQAVENIDDSALLPPLPNS